MPSSWYSQDILYLVRVLKTDLKTGLTTKEAMSRLHQSDNRDLTLYREKPFSFILWDVAKNPKTLPMLVVALAAFAYGFVDSASAFWVAASVFGIIVAETLLRVGQRYLIGEQLRVIERSTRRKARVLRNGETIEIDPQDLVIGDVLRLRAGDYIAADARIYVANRLQINEMPLTGISDLIQKIDAPLEGQLSPQEHTNMVFAGTFVHSGSGNAIVVSTGQERELVKLYSRQFLELPMCEAHDHLARVNPKIAGIAAGIGVVIGGALVALGAAETDAILQGVGMATAVFAALFPTFSELSTAIIFAQSLRQLEAMGAIVQEPEALEKLSLTTTLCFDPQGVITEDRMRLNKVFVDAQMFTEDEILAFFEDDSEPTEARDGILNHDDEDRVARRAAEPAEEAPPDLFLMFLSAAMSVQHTEPGDDGWEAVESLAKRALIDMADSIGVDWRAYETHLNKLADFPYDASRQRQSVLFQSDTDIGNLFVIGSAETVLNRCRMHRLDGREDVLQQRHKDRILAVHDRLALDSTQVLAIAYRKINGDLKDPASSVEKAERELVFLGMVGFDQHVRSDIKETLDHCSRAGLRLILMADNEMSVTFRMARDAGLLTHRSQIMSDDQLHRMNDGDFMPHIDRVSVYSRLRGEQKARVVQMLKRKGSRVAFVGRQLYDIASLRGADVGISPNQWSIDAAAHEAGILVDDVSLENLFGILKFAKDAGRAMRWMVHWVLATHIGMATLMALGALVGMAGFAPAAPLELPQLLFLELLVAAIPLTFAAKSMALVPTRRWLVANRNISTEIRWKQVIRHGVLLGAMALATSAFLYQYLTDKPSVALIAQYAALVTFAGSSFVFLVKGLVGTDSSPWRFVATNGWLVGGMVVSLGVAAAWIVSPLAGALGGMESAGWVSLSFSVEWLVVVALMVAAWFIPVSE
ncbi:MAG: HAD family hydrolase [Candidatus Poribacteria bacterium]|nr:HAD family hydrolase [Candidatus Poribacteria bacterium]